MINAVTPEFVEAHSLDIGLLSNLVNGTVRANSFGGLFSWPLGYVVIRVQVERVQGYNEDQVALVIPDPTYFGSQLPVTLGILTINWIINVIEESETDELSVLLSRSRISHLLACHQAELSHWEQGNCKSNHWSNWLEWGCQNDKRMKKLALFYQRSFMPEQRLCFLAAICTWWHRPWRMEMDPTCLMAWAS